MDPITRLQASIQQTRQIVAQTTPAHNLRSTPCPDWTVSELCNHVLGAFVMFRDIATNGAADLEALALDHTKPDLLDAFDRLAAATVEAWRPADRVGGNANMPWGEMPAAVALQVLANDILVHGWDLARATDQAVNWDPALAAETLEFAQQMFADPANRGDEFAEPVAVPAGTDPMTRLVAFLGRTP